MPWYYAGPDAKPVGPLSLEELHARRMTGDVRPETYIIEHTGQQGTAGLAWKRYSEVFPPAPVDLPPTPATSYSIPPAPPANAMISPPAPTPGAMAPVTPNPLFPSAAPAIPGQTPLAGHAPLPGQAPSVFAPAHRPDPYYQRPIKATNGWCAWGFGLGLAGFFFSFACFGILLAVPAFLLCIAGLAQVGKKQQEGKGLAIAGLAFSLLAMIISLVFIFAFAMPMVKNHEMTVTEQSTTDSE